MRLWQAEGRSKTEGQPRPAVRRPNQRCELRWLGQPRAAVPPRSGPRRFRQRYGHFEHGKADFECSAAFRPVVAGDLSLVILNYAIGGTEPEASALAHWLRGVERIEDTLGIAQAGAGVGKLHDHFIRFAPQRNLKTPTA